MIQKNDIALIIDTNIFGEIISSIQCDNLAQILKRWILTILNKMKKFPKGKKITIFCSSNTLNDYQTGFSKQGHKNMSKTVKTVFNQSLSYNRAISVQEKINLSLRKMPNPSKSKQTKRVSDKNDVRFLLLIELVAKLSTHKNYKILFASKDRQSSDTIKSILEKSDRQNRIHVAENLEAFEELISC